MKKILLSALILMSVILLTAISTASSVPFSNSYMQRSSGVSAIYWNPANLSNMQGNSELQFLPFVFQVSNNALSLQLYNDVVSSDSLSVEKRQEILEDMQGSMNYDMNFNMILFGWATKHFGLSVGSSFLMHGQIDEDYLRLVFFGNEYDQAYTFSKEDNFTQGIGIVDLSMAWGGYSLNSMIPVMKQPYIPEIKYGFTGSLLVGAGGGVDQFNGVFKASDAGLQMNQDLTVKYGGGFGFKGLFGVSADLYKSDEQFLTTGFTLDNLFGHFSNSISCEAQEYKIVADSVYMVNMDEDFFTQTDSTYDAESFETELPMRWSLGFLYKFFDISTSLDFSKYTKTSAFGSDQLDTAFGLEYEVFGHIPLRFGYMIANDSHPSITSYGLGLDWKHWETGLGFQFFDSILGMNSKGTSFAMQMKFRF